jgi:hypothetical protein
MHPGVVIERRETVTPEELDDPGVVVFDTGRRHEPDLNNFDHHQFDESAPPSCALSLYLQHLGYYKLARAVWPWLEFREILDTCGVQGIIGRYGLASAKDAVPFFSPVEKAILDMLSHAVRITPDNFLHMLLRRIGETMLSELERYTEQMELLGQHTSTFTTATGSVVMQVDPEFLGVTSHTVEAFCQLHHPEVDIICLAEKAHQGWTIVARHDGTDFGLAEKGPVKLNFVHDLGHVAKTRNRVGVDEISSLVDACSQAA